MTVRPCPTCGGQGRLKGCAHFPRSQGAHAADCGTRKDWPCPSCADMPWLKCPNREGDECSTSPFECDHCQGRGEFKSDPETVMEWNFTMNMPTAAVAATSVNDRFMDDIGWIVRPERLDTAE